MVRRLIVAVLVLSVMVAMTLVGSPTKSSTTPTIALGPAAASAQVPGRTLYCGPWHRRWYVSQSGWWYFWWWRWCYNPSIEGGWYRDWAGWHWDVFAGPGFRPGFQYDTGPFPIGVGP